ncbi:MAG: tRNA (adenosine(37)-N6)-threonylcarbamoyltransferase complex dimerization subunit type 1 TsaB [Alphaproteobacteria bacterium]|nr:tRNA (adenosine(37)-N6)-threonylcarbamoyltransferase complex dimerization subunit type 1 TsaB [Alphaproteobacteria bacterium]
MLVLALDTAMSSCAAALVRDGRALAVHTRTMRHGHAEALLPMIEQVMAEGQRAYADLDLVAATVGPGAFTGIRVGLAAARGIALAAGKPGAGVTTLEAIAAAWPGAPVLAAIESRREDLFAQIFDAAGAALCEPRAVAPEGLAALVREAGLAGPFRLAGDGAPRAAAALKKEGLDVGAIETAPAPDPVRVAAIAAARMGLADSLPLRPLYLRPPDVTLPKNG